MVCKFTAPLKQFSFWMCEVLSHYGLQYFLGKLCKIITSTDFELVVSKCLNRLSLSQQYLLNMCANAYNWNCELYAAYISLSYMQTYPYTVILSLNTCKPIRNFHRSRRIILCYNPLLHSTNRIDKRYGKGEAQIYNLNSTCKIYALYNII